MNEHIEVEAEQLALATRPTYAVEAPPPAPLWGTSDSAVILAKATATANALKDVVKSRGLISNISGKEYPRCEAWTLLGTLLGVFPVLCWTKEVEKGWEARVEAKTLSGAIVGAAEAQCLRTERNWGNRDDFALRSMAQTRATAKALRMPLGFVMTLAGYESTPAEEMTHEAEPRHSAPQTRSKPAPVAAAPPSRQSQPAGAASSTPLPKGKTVESLIEAGRKKLLAEIPTDLERPLWVCLLRRGGIMDNERISDVTASALFPTATKFCGEPQTGATYETASKAMKGDYDALMNETRSTVATDDEKRAFDAAHGAPGTGTEPPAKPKSAQAKAGASTEAAPADQWFFDVICPIPHKGEKRSDYEKHPDTIGSLYDAAKNGDGLSRKRLFGFANNWKPEPRHVDGKTYQPSPADLKFREALDAFLSWEEAKGKQVATQMRTAAEDAAAEEAMAQNETEPPF